MRARRCGSCAKRGGRFPSTAPPRGDGNILDAISPAPLAAELTLQPVRRYGVDAAILFSDIVVPLHAVGFGVEVEAGRGPVVARPFSGEDDLDRLRPLDPEADTPYVAEATSAGRGRARGAGVPLIGFAGAPFTVASYLVEGGPSRTFAHIKALMHSAPDLWDRLHGPTGRHGGGVAAGPGAGGARQAFQLFDSWAGALSPTEYARFVAAGHPGRASGLADLGVPSILFGVGTGELLGAHGRGGGSDVVGVDWRVPLDEARRRVGPRHSCRATSILRSAWPRGRSSRSDARRPGASVRPEGDGTPLWWGGHIFNLGHGVLPETDPRDPPRRRRPGAPGDGPAR